MAAVDADADPLAGAGRLDEALQLVEVAAERPLGAGRVLEQDRAALGLGERLADDLAGALDRLGDGLALAAAGVQDDAVGADRVAEPQGVDQRG